MLEKMKETQQHAFKWSLFQDNLGKLVTERQNHSRFYSLCVINTEWSWW